MADRNALGRREFLKKAAGATVGVLGFPYIVSSSALGNAGNISPSERITMGCIGMGWQGGSNMNSFLREKDCQIIAVCDVDKKHLQDAVNRVNSIYKNKDCTTYGDYRELLARNDIDTVSLGLPDHWHAIPAIEAAKSGKDIFGEKPLSHDLRQGRAL
jgi:predicted dehydrogenase